MEQPKLKPCPFCGGKAGALRSADTKMVYVICETCDIGCFIASQHGGTTVIFNVWNTRAAIPQEADNESNTN